MISFNSCRKYKEDDNPHFNEKILDGFAITSIAFNSHGTAWIGTLDQGIIKDSLGYTTIYNSNNSTFQDTSIIWDIKVDKKDNVWIGGHDLTKYDGNKFITYNSGNSPIPEDWIYCIAIDSKDNIWFTSCRSGQGGLVKFDGINWEVFTPDNSLLPVNYIKSIAIDKNDNVWLALQEKVNKTYLVKISDSDWTIYDNSNLGFKPFWYANIETNSKNQLCAGIDYTMWLYPENPTGPQVFVYDGTNSTQLKFDTNSDLHSILIDKEDNIWCIATYIGENFEEINVYAVYDGTKWFTDYTSLKNEYLLCIEQAPDNKIWIGTNNGIYISD